MLAAIKKKMDLILYLGICTYLTLIQKPQRAAIIATSTTFFTLSYIFLQQTGYLNPPKNLKLEPHIEAEWINRVVATPHAVILAIGSILCYLEWPYYLIPSHAWHVPADEATNETEYLPIKFSCFFVGFLQWDMLWLIYHKKTNHDAAAMVHHVLYIMITHYVIYGTYFCRGFAWLAFGELSTPFLHMRWFYAVMDKKEDRWYLISSLLFSVTFLFSRVVCYGLGLVDLWFARDAWSTLSWGLNATVVGLSLLYVLNLFWASKVVSAVWRLMMKMKMIRKNNEKCD